MEMTKTNIKAFRADFEEAMKALEAKYEIKIGLQGISYGSDSFKSKIEVQNTSSKSQKIIWEREHSAAGWKYPNLRKIEYEKPLIGQDGRQYVVVGFNTRASKNILKVEDCFTKQRYRCSPGFLGL